MSKSHLRIPSPTRSQGAPITPRRARPRRTLSVASPARSDVSAKLSSVVEKFIKNDKFTMSPMKRKSVLPDDTQIEAPRRASWWKRLEGSSRDVLEALDTNKMPDDLLLEEYEFEVERDKEKTLSESSDNESVASIVVPQRRLFNQPANLAKQAEGKFADVMGSRKSLGRTNIEDISIDNAPRNLFNKGPRNRPGFPAALLNSTNKTINKTEEPEPSRPSRPNLFGQAGTKRKNMFTDFVLSESEEDSEVQPKVFGFRKYDNKRMSLGTRNRRMPSLTPSTTTEIDIDDWNLLPSSTMIGAPEVSRVITDEDMDQVANGNQDNTLTEDNTSLPPEMVNESIHKSKRGSDENNRTLTNVMTIDANKRQEETNVSKKNNKTLNHSKIRLHDSVKENTSQNASLKVKKGELDIENIALEQEKNNHRPTELGTSIEDIMAELHGETIAKNKSQKSLTESLSTTKDANTNQNTNMQNLSVKDKSQQHTKLRADEYQGQETSATNQEDMKAVSEKNKREHDKELSSEDHASVNSSKEASITNRKGMDDISEKDKSEEGIEPTVEDYESSYSSKEASKTHQEGMDVSELVNSGEDIERSADEQNSQNSSKEASAAKEDEDMEHVFEKDKSEEDEPSSEKEASNTSKNENIEDTQGKETIVANSQIDESQHSSKEISIENQDEEMEEMVWNDDENETREIVQAELNEDVEPNYNGEIVDNDSNHDIKQNVSVGKNIINKSQKIVELSVDDDQMEQNNDVVDETPNNSTTSGNKRKEKTYVKSPEAVLQNMTKDNESFRPIGRSTSFRKSKSVIEHINIRPSMAPVQESTLGSDGSKNSSTEGSGWDSHRTTRKTLRQTFGKDFTPRKSLRALVMEQSAKRQTEVYNRNASKLTQRKNKTVLEDGIKNSLSKINKTTSALESTRKNASKVSMTKNKTVIDDIDNHLIRNRRISNCNTSSDQLPHSKSPAHETSAHHVSEPLISKPQVSYHKSVHELNDPEMSEHQISHDDESINIAMEDNDDSGPEISIHASYGQGMSREASDHQVSAEIHRTSGHKMYHGIKELSRRDTSVRIKSSQITHQEELDYEASEHENSEQEISDTERMGEKSNQKGFDSVEMQEEEKSENEEEAEGSDHESEVENVDEESQQEDEAESEEELVNRNEESQQEIQEESQHEIETESDQEKSELERESEREESQQEIEVESDQEESEQDIDAESEQEGDSESEQEIEAESEDDEREDHDMSHENAQSDQESAHDISEEPGNEMQSDQDENNLADSDHIVSGLNSQYQLSNSNRTERVVFDNEISEQAIDYELSDRVSRQITENDISGQFFERETTAEIAGSRESEHSRVHDVSVGTKKSMLLMEMQKIAQQNIEIRQKIREKVQNSLKLTRNFNKMSPIQSKFSIRRINKPEPKKPKTKPRPRNIPMESLPKEFVEDLMYKPPKRFQPGTAPWITKRLYKFLETKLEPKYDYRARIRAEELVQTIHSFTKLVRRRDLAPQNAVDELKREMARLHVVDTHFEFYEFFHEFMPREIRIKVNPDVVNKIQMPRNGVFSNILPARVARE